MAQFLGLSYQLTPTYHQIDRKMSSVSLRILLVEDDELFRLGVKFRLQQESDIEITTVRVHIHAMLHKLGARDRSHAILIAQQQRLDAPPNLSEN